MIRKQSFLFTIFTVAVTTLPARGQDITTGLVGLWKFNETTGTVAADSSGNSNNGTYVGNPTLGVTGARGLGAYFSADGKYMTAPASTTLNALGVSNADFSVAFWVNPSAATGGWRPLIHKGSIDFERGPGVWLHPSDNGIHFRISTNSNSNDGADSVAALPSGSWSHIACVKAGNKWRCYVNGTLDTEYTLSAGTVGNSGPLYVGDDPWYAGSNTSMDDVRVYSRALTGADVNFLAQTAIAKRLLLVVVNSVSLSTGESFRKSLFEDYGYVVTPISATASQATFDTSAVANDVAYICQEINSSDLNTKLTDKPLGVVSEKGALADTFAMASSYSNPSGTTLTITKNNHYITSTFAIGSITIMNSSQPLDTFSGTFSPDFNQLGSISGAAALFCVEQGGKLSNSTTAAGRRVQLPWGGSGCVISELSSNGIVLVTRALAWAGGVVGYWKLDETSGTTANDSSVNVLNGTLTNSSFDTSSTAGSVGTALSVDGVDDYITIPNSSVVQLTKALSMSAWIKGSGSWGTGSYANVIVRKGDSNPNNYQFAIENGFVAMGLDGNDGSNAHGNTLLQAGVWYHVAATWDGSYIRIYVNGVLDNTPTARAAPVGTDTRALYLCGRISTTDVFCGVVDDIRLFNYALDVDELLVVKNQATPGVHIIKWVETQ